MPDWDRHIRNVIACLRLDPAHEAEVIQELVQHLDDRYREELARGATHDDAYNAALGELRQSERRRKRGGNIMSALLQDLRFGFRLIRKSWTFSAVAVLTLALGVGANGAIFSIVNAVLLRDLPYPDPEKLVVIWEARPREGVNNNVVSPADFSDWRNRQQVFEGIAAYTDGSPLDLSGVGEPVRLIAGNVSASFFKVLGVTPAIGRDFAPDEEQRGRNNVVILNHGFWQRQFGGDPTIIGRRLRLGDDSFEVIGVLPASFKHSNELVDLWYPLDFTSEGMRARFNHFLIVYGRLKPGITIARAQQETDRISAQLQSEVELQNQMHGAHVVSLREDLTGNLRSQLLILMAAVGFVLLIACVNVANLMLSRGAARIRELAIRTSLGAGRFVIVRQLLMECLCVSFLGALAGIPIAMWGVSLLQSSVPASIPRLNDASLDPTVIAYMLAVALLTGLIFGLAPAFQTVRLNLNDTLKESNPAGGASRRRLRSTLVIAEIALAFVLLIGAGLMVRSLLKLLSVNPGFDATNVLTVSLAPRGQSTPFLRELLERVGALPGVADVGLTSALPMTAQDARTGFVVEGLESTPENPIRVHPRMVTPGYFAAMRIRLREGRLLTQEDLQGGDVTRQTNPVAVVNRTAAERYWPGKSPIGKYIQILGTRREVVGIVDDVRHWGLATPANPELYMAGYRSPTNLVVRTAQEPASLAQPVREQVRQLAPDLPLAAIRTMEEVRGRSVASPRFYLALLGVFALVSLVLACAGIYGVMSYTVNQSTREIGIRIAMGARPGQVIRQFVREGVKLVGVSLIVGGVAAYGLTRLMRTLLFGITPTDPQTYIAIAALTATIALLACYIPARRAAKVDPLTALKHE